ncbi:MAG: putative transporter [Ramlibacter sp.]|jgi:MFS family permease|nr:putative transporter [Ramlibacter sp.]
MASPTDDAGLSPLAVAAAGALSLAVAMGIGRFAFTPMLPLMIRQAQLDVAAGGWLAAANYAGYLAGALTAVHVPLTAGRLGATALLLTAALTAAMAVSGSLPLWIVLRFAAGMCSAWAFVSTSVWCLGALARMQRPSWGSAVYAGVGAGIAIAGLYCLVGGAAGTDAGSLWLQLGGLAVVLMLPVLAVLRRLRVQAFPRSANPGVAARAPSGTLGIVICYGAFGFGYILPATFLPVLARSVVDDPRLFGLAWPVFGATAAASTFLAGWCMRHFTRLQVWSVAHLLMGIGVLLPGLCPSAWTIALSALLVGGTFMVITMAGVQEIRSRATGDPTALVGRMTTAFALGQIAGPAASSLLQHLPGVDGLGLALQLAAASLLISAAWLWRESRPKKQPPRGG